MKRFASAFPLLLALAFLLFHLPYLPQSLEDLDSINFAFGLHDFDVTRHQPHPPGYPLFIVAARAAYTLTGSEPRALALVSVVSGALGILAIAALFRRLSPSASVLATAVAAAAPLYWFTAARPLSDMAGLAAAVAIQALILRADSARAFYVAAFVAAVAAGIRVQVAVLTVPLLVYEFFRLHRRSEPRDRAGQPRPLHTILYYVAGVLAWAIPLMIITGPRAYWRVLFGQGSEDLSGIRMLWTTPTPRELMDALYYAFVSPWATWTLAAVVLILAIIGVGRAYRDARAGAIAIAAAFGPYLLFDVLFQETFTTRYAVPLVIPIAWFAAMGASVLPRRSGVVVAVLVAIAGAHVGGTSIAAYSRQPAPAFRLFDDMVRAARAASAAPTLAMDRREALDLRKAMQWSSATLPKLAGQLPSPPMHEWLEPVKYWSAGGAGPIWFIADPLRTDVDLIQHGAPAAYRWPLPYPVLIGGARPGEVDWYRLGAPEWFVEEGWALTPEAAGTSQLDRRATTRGIAAWSNQTSGGMLAIGGRNFSASVAHVSVGVDYSDGPLLDFDAQPGFFLNLRALPNAEPLPSAGFHRLVVRSDQNVAIEQFDISRTRTIFGFGAGWHEAEYNPSTGLRWRWMSEHGELRFTAPHADSVDLHLEGESPRKYFSRPSHVRIRSGTHTIDRALDDDFSFDVRLPVDVDGMITIETDQAYIPAERWWPRTRDRRHLGLRIFKCELSPVSGPDRAASSQTAR